MKIWHYNVMLDGVQKHSIGYLCRWLKCGNINTAKHWKYKALLKYWLYDAEESKNYVHIFGSWCLWFWCFVQLRILLVLSANQVIDCNLYPISDEITGIIQQIYVTDMQSGPITSYLTHLSLDKMNGHHFAVNNFKCIFMNEKLCILNQISLKFFVRAQSKINQHWFGWCLCNKQVTRHYLNQCWPVSLTHAAPERDELINEVKYEYFVFTKVSIKNHCGFLYQQIIKWSHSCIIS